MVIDVSSRPVSIDEFFYQIDLEVNESIHEFEYSLLLDKYNYLQENGVVMEETEENSGFKSKIKKLIGFIIQKVKDVWDWIKKKFKEIKNKLTGDKKKKVEQSEAETDKEAKEAIDQLNAEANNPTESSGKKSQGIFNIFKKKQEKKAKDLDIEKDEKKSSHKTYGFRSIDEDGFWKAIADKNLLSLKVSTVSSMLDDPTFERGETRKILSILQDKIPEIFEDEVELGYEERLDPDKWDKRYFTKLTYWFQENFAKSRIPYIEKVGKAVHKDTAESYKKSMAIRTQQKESRLKSNKSFIDKMQFRKNFEKRIAMLKDAHNAADYPDKIYNTPKNQWTDGFLNELYERSVNGARSEKALRFLTSVANKVYHKNFNYDNIKSSSED